MHASAHLERWKDAGAWIGRQCLVGGAALLQAEQPDSHAWQGPLPAAMERNHAPSAQGGANCMPGAKAARQRSMHNLLNVGATFHSPPRAPKMGAEIERW